MILYNIIGDGVSLCQSLEIILKPLRLYLISRNFILTVQLLKARYLLNEPKMKEGINYKRVDSNQLDLMDLIRFD